jgi:hypothetical protein
MIVMLRILVILLSGGHSSVGLGIGRVRDFSLQHNVQTEVGAEPASYPTRTMGSS